MSSHHPPTPPPENDIVDMLDDMRVDDDDMILVGEVGDMADDESEDDEPDSDFISDEYPENEVIPVDKDDSVMTFSSNESGGNLKPVYCCCFGPDDQEVVLGGENDLAMVWNINTRELIFETKHEDSVIAVEYSFDNKYLLTGDYGGYIKVFLRKHNSESNTVSFENIFEYKIGETVTWLFWHTKAYVVILGTKEGAVYYFNIPSGAFKILFGEGLKTYCAKLLPDCVHLAVGYRNSVLKIWDMKTGTIQSDTKLFNQREHVLSLDINYNGIIMAGGLKGSVVLIGKNGKVLANMKTDDPEQSSVEGVSFCTTPGSNLAASVTMEGDINIWDISTKSLRHSLTVSFENGDGVIGIRWIPGSNNFVTFHMRATINVWDANGGQHLKIFRGHTSIIQNMVISKDGKRVLTSSDDGTMKLFDLH